MAAFGHLGKGINGVPERPTRQMRNPVMPLLRMRNLRPPRVRRQTEAIRSSPSGRGAGSVLPEGAGVMTVAAGLTKSRFAPSAPGDRGSSPLSR